MNPFDQAWALLKEETPTPEQLEWFKRQLNPEREMGKRTSMSFGENIDDARSFIQLPTKTAERFKGDGKKRIGPTAPKPENEKDWHQIAHLPFIEGNEAEGYGSYESESDAIKDLMNVAASYTPDFAQDGFYHSRLHPFDYDKNEWVEHLGEDAPPTGTHERVFRAKVMSEDGPFVSHNPLYPEWVWTKINREQDEEGKHHLTLSTAKYPYSLDELYENLQQNPYPYFESGAIQFGNDETGGTI
jgi:hypothetical protein